MESRDFILKWSHSALGERQGAQSHFLDLCALLDEPAPADADPTGKNYAFEKGAQKTTGRSGWADVWKRGCFAWEYKAPGGDLSAAYSQLQQYAPALDNPPLLIVSDTRKIIVRTNWTNTVTETHAIELADLAQPEIRQKLKWAFGDPDRLRPQKTRQAVTEAVAGQFASLAESLRQRGHDAVRVAHFVNRLVFCMFAEDVKLLRDDMFKQLLKRAREGREPFAELASELFRAMNAGGRVGFVTVEYFNGGLFDDDEAFELTPEELDTCLEAAELDWSEIDPSILGTLFVRGLDPNKREELGAEYTSREKILAIIDPVITAPWLREWTAVRDKIEAALAGPQAVFQEAISGAAEFPELSTEIQSVRGRLSRSAQLPLFDELPKLRRKRAIDDVRAALRTAERAYNDAAEVAEREFREFLERLRRFRVLDPACGSGNFLYLALHELKTIEWRVAIEGEALGFDRTFPTIGPEVVHGIELNPYAAELARISVWIGEIQWMIRNGFDLDRAPILRPLQTIDNKNAIIQDDGSPAEWPAANVIVGNPPYMGAKLMNRRLGRDMTRAIREIYKGRLPGFTDLVCYWFENARQMIEQGRAQRAGLVATNSIRKNTNLPVMRRILETTSIFAAWPEEKWDIEGAAVDVSLICFGDVGDIAPTLNGSIVSTIHADLTSGPNLTLARPLAENANVAMLGIQKSGPFDVPGIIARAWLKEPRNPNGKSNAGILKPYWNGDDLTGRPRDYWFIDLPLNLSETDAALYEKPFQHIAHTPDEDGLTVQELRAALEDRAHERWWEPHWPRPGMRRSIQALSRYIVTPETAEHRVFGWLSYPTLPDKNLIVIPREDDLMFGLLQSRFHELWALRKGSDLQDRPRYTHTTTFGTFPFPRGMTPDIDPKVAVRRKAGTSIAEAARLLDEHRNQWLWPADLYKIEAEIVDGFPARRIPNDSITETRLRSRTLTRLYNEPPDWLRADHERLNAAVAEAYEFNGDIGDDEAVLAFLLQENLARRAT